MEKEVRNAIQRATQAARKVLETELAQQLEGTFDIRLDGRIAPGPGSHLDVREKLTREKLVSAIEYLAVRHQSKAEAVQAYLRESAFTVLNRFVGLKMLEGRKLIQECVSKGDQSSGFKEFYGLAPGLVQLPDQGYRLYLECIFDEIATEVGVLFDRRDVASILWPRRQALTDVLDILNGQDLDSIWSEDETIGWFYQFFNSLDERKKIRDESAAPRNSRELAIRNQFFTPRYVVQFLVDNTVGRIWLQMYSRDSALAAQCEYYIFNDEADTPRPKKDPRDLKILDPACGSGHFLLYTFDLLLKMYEEAWNDPAAPVSSNGTTLRQDYSGIDDLRAAAPKLILENNLFGIEIDPRAAQIAALALWLRAQRAYGEYGISAADRSSITKTHIVVAEPMPGDDEMVEEFARILDPPILCTLFKKIVSEMKLAGEMGSLLKIERAIEKELLSAREQFVKQQQEPRRFAGMERPRTQGELDLSGIDDDSFFRDAEERMYEALRRYSESASGALGVRRRLFSGDAEQGIALIETVRTRFDTVLMNPPFGAGTTGAKKAFEAAYPRTKNDLYAAFVERGIELLPPRGMLGAITSRTGFFLSSFQKWREEILLKEAPPLVFADLGYGVLDTAMVEVAAYCLEKAR